MSVRLVEITEKNFRECVRLSVREDQRFVASNVFSIAQSKVEPRWITRAVYADERMVGFVMYHFDMEGKELYLCRFMIDQRYQHKGYGKATLDELKRLAMEKEGIERMRLSTNPENSGGIRIYEKFGFKDTGELDGDEEVFVLELGKERTRGSPPFSIV
jgi:diamine N-acetyltransferase